MKKQILMLIIGILIGAIITTGVFLVLKGDNGDQMQMEKRDFPESMDGNFVNNGDRMKDRLNDENEINQENSENNNESNT